MKSVKLKKFQAGGSATMSDDMQCPEASMNPQLDVTNREEATNNSDIAYAVNGGTSDMGCANCALFDISKRMQQCVQDGSESSGYCWENSFNCDSAAVCNKYETGGPIIDDQVSYEIGAEKADGPAPQVDPTQQIAPDPAMQQGMAPPGMAPPGMPPMEQPQMQTGPPQMPMMRYGGALPTFQGEGQSEVTDDVSKIWLQKLMEFKMQNNPGMQKTYNRNRYPIPFKEWLEMSSDPEKKAIIDFIRGKKNTVKTTEIDETTYDNARVPFSDPGTTNNNVEPAVNEPVIEEVKRLGGSHMYYSGGDLPKAQYAGDIPPIGSPEWYAMQNQTDPGIGGYGAPGMEAPGQAPDQIGTADWNKKQSSEWQTMQASNVKQAEDTMAVNLNQYGQGNPLLETGKKNIEQKKAEDAAAVTEEDASGPPSADENVVARTAEGRGDEEGGMAFNPGAPIGSAITQTGTDAGMQTYKDAHAAQDAARRDEVIEKSFGDKEKGGIGSMITGMLAKGVGIAAILNKGFEGLKKKKELEHYKTKLSADELANSGVFPTMTANRAETRAGHHTNTGIYGAGWKTPYYEDAYVPDYGYAAYGGETLETKIYGGPLDIDDQLLNELIAAGADIERL